MYFQITSGGDRTESTSDVQVCHQRLILLRYRLNPNLPLPTLNEPHNDIHEAGILITYSVGISNYM